LGSTHYTIERGELLMWLQHVLIREEQEAPSRGETRPIEPSPSTTAPAAHTRKPAAAPAPRRSWTTGLIDVPTGAGTVLALRRDVLIERSWRQAETPGFVLVVAKMEPTASGTPEPTGETLEIMLRTLAEVAGQTLDARDRVYRSGSRELTLLLRDADEEGARAAGRALAAALKPLLAFRRLPPARLTMRLLDPNVVLSVLPSKKAGGHPTAA